MLDDLKALLRKRPFEPFRVVLDDGEPVPVMDHELARVMAGQLIVRVLDPNERSGERVVFCHRTRILSVERLVWQPIDMA